MTVVVQEGTSESLTLNDAAALFEAFPEDDTAPDTEAAAKPPAPDAVPPEEPESEDAEAASEQPEAEDTPTEDEAEPEAAAPEEPAEAELYAVMVDGAEVKVTRDELLKGYSRQSDYSRKTMKLAEDRKAVEAKDAELAKEREQYAAQLASLENMIKQQTPKEPDWHTLRVTATPAEFAAAYAEWSHHKEEMKLLADERKAAEERVQQDQRKAFESRFNEQKRLLVEAIPEFGDAEKAKALREEIAAAAESVGLTREDLNGVDDHRLMVLLHKAAKYDALQKKKPVIQQKIEKVKAATPGATGAMKPKPKSKLQVARDRLAKTGSIYDAAAAYEAMEG